MPECTSRGQQEKKYVYKATLGKTYGLTPSMISELGAPDEYCDNPHYRSGWPASLYLVERVEAWVRDNTERLAKAKEQRARRSVSLKAAKERNRAERLREGLEWVTGFTIEMQQPMPATLLNDAHKVYPRVPHPEDITEKALHVYVRHWLTNFDDLRGRLSGDEFEGELGQLLRERVNSAIAISVLDWRQRHSGRGEIAHASLLPTWEHFFNRLVVAGEGDERSRRRLTTEVVRAADIAGGHPDKRETDGAAYPPTTERQSEMMRQVLNEVIALLRRIGWRGRKLVKSARMNRAGVWRVDPEAIRALLGIVPFYNSPYGPRLTDCLDLLTSGTGPTVAPANQPLLLEAPE